MKLMGVWDHRIYINSSLEVEGTFRVDLISNILFKNLAKKKKSERRIKETKKPSTEPTEGFIADTEHLQLDSRKCKT